MNFGFDIEQFLVEHLNPEINFAGFRVEMNSACVFNSIDVAAEDAANFNCFLLRRYVHHIFQFVVEVQTLEKKNNG